MNLSGKWLNCNNTIIPVFALFPFLIIVIIIIYYYYYVVLLDFT